MDFKLLVLACYKAPLLTNEIKTPSFIAMKSLLLMVNVKITKCEFTPILPHPSTEYSTIYRCMKNCQDFHNQHHIYDPLWFYEEIYHIEKGIQLLKLDEFKSILLRMGCFHTENIVLTCLGKCLEKIGIKKVFEITEVFRPDTVKNVFKVTTSLLKKGIFLFDVFRIICKPGGYI